MNTRSICGRCHRLRASVGQRYCATCRAGLEARPRRVAPDQAAAVLAAAAARRAAAPPAAAAAPPPGPAHTQPAPRAAPSPPAAVEAPAAAPAPANLPGLPAFVLPTIEDEAG
jgi:hypothetical protein